MPAITKFVAVAAVFASVAVLAAAHFEPNGSVPQPGSTTAVGDPKANVGEPGPKPGSPAAAAAAAAASSKPSTGPSTPGATVAASANGGGASGAGGVGPDEVQPTSTPTPGMSDSSASASTSPDDTTVATASSEAGAASATAEAGAAATSEADAETSGSPDASVEPTTKKSSKKDDGSACFPADATVELESGEVKRMAELAVGDRVHVGRGMFSDVFMFTHKTADVANNFIALESESGAKLRLTAGHFLYVNGGLAAAKAVVAGDVIELGNGQADVVSRVSKVLATGLYNPQTLQGDVVVDNVRASTYTTAVEPAFAHAVLTPLRAAYSALGFSTASLEAGSALDRMLPSGPAAVY